MELYSERLSEDWHVEQRLAQHVLVLMRRFSRNAMIISLSQTRAGTVLHVGSDRKKATLKAMVRKFSRGATRSDRERPYGYVASLYQCYTGKPA